MFACVSCVCVCVCVMCVCVCHMCVCHRGRVIKGADGKELDADELAEDIYAGLEGEGGDDLRPAKPEPVRVNTNTHAHIPRHSAVTTSSLH